MSDDDFLIEDDEGIHSDVKDEFFLASNSSSDSPSPVRFDSPGTPTKSNISPLPGNQSPNPIRDEIKATNAALSGATVNPLVVAPATQHTLSTPQNKSVSLAPQALSTNNSSEVIKNIQDGGSFLLKKFTDFLQSPSSYIPLSPPPSGNTRPAATSGSSEDSDDLFLATYYKFCACLKRAEKDTFTILDDFITDFNAQESLRFDGSDLIEKQEREYFGLRQKRIETLRLELDQGKDITNISDEEALNGIVEQQNSHDKAVEDGEVQTQILREHQSGRGQMFQNIVFCASSLFNKLLIWEGSTDQERNLIGQCIEEYLIPHVQKKLYCPDRWADWRFAQIVGSCQFLTPADLGIAHKVSNDLISRCGALLVEVNFLPTPRKKISAIVQACKHIINYLNEVQSMHMQGIQQQHQNLYPTDPTQSSSSSSTPQQPTTTSSPTISINPSKTDEFLALVIYVLIQTNPPNILSNIAYLITCRSNSDTMLSDDGYFFAHMAIAVHFLCKLKESKNSPKVSLEGGVFLLEPEWMPIVADKEAKFLHLLPTIEKSRELNDISEYKSIILRLANDVMKRKAELLQQRIAASTFVSSTINNPNNTINSYSPEQIEIFKRDPLEFLKQFKFWNSNPEEIKTPTAISQLLAEYKQLVASQYQSVSK